jgi:hypothetical protein
MKILKRLACLLLLLLLLAGTWVQPASAQCSPQTWCNVQYCWGYYYTPDCTTCLCVYLCYDLCGNIWYADNVGCCA